MAAASSSNVSKLLECSLCLDVFKQPKCLPCIHTFCLNCLQGYVEKSLPSDQLQCPLCREKFSVPSDGLTSLPNNFFIQSMMALNDKPIEEGSKEDVEVKCDICGAEKELESCPFAEKYCPECDQNLCESCTGCHGRIKASKSHHLVALLKKKNLPICTPVEVQRYCGKHKNDPLRIYCISCEITVCLMCMVTDHNGHKCKEIKDMSSTFRDQFEIQVAKMMENMKVIHKKYEELKSTEQRVMEEALTNEQKIKERCLEMRRTIDKFEEQLLNDSIKFRDEKMKVLKTDIYDIEFHRKLLENYAMYLEEVKKNGSDCDVVFNGKQLLERVDSLLAGSQVVLNVTRMIPCHNFYPHSGGLADCSVVGRISGKGQIIVLGLNRGNDVVQQNICRISLDASGTVDVIDSTPALIDIESAACVVNNNLYAVGIGSFRNELWKWSAGMDEWRKCADMPPGRSKHCVAHVDDSIYVLGGYLVASERIIASVLRYDISSDRWMEVGHLRRATMSTACVTFKQCIYVFGGIGKTEDLDCVQIYDTVTNEFSLSYPSMPDVCRLMRAVVWKSKALIIGGISCYVYDFDLNMWQERFRFKTSVYQFGLTIDNDTLYIIGGGMHHKNRNNEDIWTCTNELRSLSVNDLISDNKTATWKHHANLPSKSLVSSYSAIPLLM